MDISVSARESTVELAPAYRTATYRGLRVSYVPEIDGGGADFGQEFVRVVREKVGRVGHVFEYCAGPGFIGFSLLAHGLCDRLTLADINPQAVEACRVTVERNGLADRVAVYQSDCLEQIDARERWDLVVSNPPHWSGTNEQYQGFMRYYDPDWIVHRKFYRDIRKFLNPRGAVLFQEHGGATRAELFQPMIEQGGLRITEVFQARPLSVLECLFQPGQHLYYNVRSIPRWTRPSPLYFIWSQAA